jgi:tetratricopeptide (TPR) repeat protein
MTPKPHFRDCKTAVLMTGLLALLAGCAQMQSLKRSIGHAFGVHAPKVTTSKAPASAQSAPAPAVEVEPVVPLKTIVSRQLQNGHYATGKEQLQRYLQVHPNDRAARDLWRQLTIDPDRQLGTRSRMHVVKSGESYSSLAARYLGDADRFLVLARYNHASDPSDLRVGQRVRIPLDAPHASAGRKADSETAATPSKTTSAPTSSASSTPGNEGKAAQLQRQSVALFEQGRRTQAVDRLGKALDIDPHLKSSGSQADSVRKQLLSDYHQRAIVLYRDQKLSQAIHLWDKILTIDPHYEPAIIYRARAQELQDRLKQL